MEIVQEIQKKILVKLMHNPGMHYNELWGKEGESNKFNYHLQRLIDDGLVTKKDDEYKLTTKGKKIVTHLDGETGNKNHKPVVCSFIVGYNSKTKKILINIRKKEPFYGYAGIPGGKIDFGNSPIKTAEEEFLEETGLKGKMKLKVVSNYNTYNDGELMHHLIAFTYICENPTGELIKEDREGRNEWIDVKDIDKHPRYPDLDLMINNSLAKGDKIHFLNIHRWQEEEKFVDMKIFDDF